MGCVEAGDLGELQRRDPSGRGPRSRASTSRRDRCCARRRRRATRSRQRRRARRRRDRAPRCRRASRRRTAHGRSSPCARRRSRARSIPCAFRRVGRSGASRSLLGVVGAGPRRKRLCPTAKLIGGCSPARAVAIQVVRRGVRASRKPARSRGTPIAATARTARRCAGAGHVVCDGRPRLVLEGGSVGDVQASECVVHGCNFASGEAADSPAHARILVRLALPLRRRVRSGRARHLDTRGAEL